MASSISYQIGWPSLKCFIPSLALSCTVRTVRRDVIDQEGKGVGTLQETLRALGPPVPEAWDVAPKVLSLRLCKDGQNNVLNCSTDLKSKSGCDVQTPQTGNGLTTGGVEASQSIESIPSGFLTATVAVDDTDIA